MSLLKALRPPVLICRRSLEEELLPLPNTIIASHSQPIQISIQSIHRNTVSISIQFKVMLSTKTTTATMLPIAIVAIAGVLVVVASGSGTAAKEPGEKHI